MAELTEKDSDEIIRFAELTVELGVLEVILSTPTGSVMQSELLNGFSFFEELYPPGSIPWLGDRVKTIDYLQDMGFIEKGRDPARGIVYSLK